MMSTPKNHRPNVWGKIALAIFILVAVAGVAYFHYRADWSQMSSSKGRELKAMAGVKATQVQLWRREMMAEGRRAAKDPQTISLVAALREAPETQPVREQLTRHLLEEVGLADSSEILVFDSSARALASSKGAPGRATAPTLEAVRAAIKKKGQAFTGFYQSADGTVSVDLATVIQGAGGGVLGAMVFRSNTVESLFPMMQSRSQDSATTKIFLVRKEGDRVLTLAEPPPGSQTTAMQTVPLAQATHPAVMAVTRAEKVGGGRDNNGTNILCAHSAVPDSDWFLTVTTDQDAAWREIASHVTNVTGLIVLGFVFLVLMVAYIYRTDQARILNNLLEVEASQKASRSLFESVINSLPIRVMWKDLNSRYLGCNLPFARDAGLEEPRDIVGKTDNDLPWSEQAGRFSDDDREVMCTGKSKLLYEIVQKSSDGRSLPLLVSKIPLRDLDNRISGVIVAYLDISRLKKTEEELRNFRTAVEQSANTIVMTDPSGNIEYVNPAFEKTTGYEAAEVLGQNPRILSSGDQSPAFYKELWETISSGGIWRGEFHNKRKDGSLYWESATISPIVNPEGKIVKFLAIKEGISERKILEANLREALAKAESATRAKSDFLAVMSHELRTPLNGVLGFADLLVDSRLNAQQQSYAKTITGSGQHLLAVVNDILDFSSIESGHLTLDSSPVDLANLLESSCFPIRKSVADKGLGFRCNIDDRAPRWFMGDAHRLRQILINLLGNAVKFTSYGSVAVEVHAVDEGGRSMLEFAVSDTGPGIAPEALGILFRPFSQVDSTLHRKFDGTGLGLAISQRIAKAMGGEITVDSTLGTGSLFTLHIPVEPVPPGLEPVSVSSDSGNEKAAQGEMVQNPIPPSEVVASRGAVLVVEDDKTSSLLTRKILEGAGYQPVIAWNGQEAVDVFESGKFVAILMDMQMPVMDGLEATRMIREQEVGERVPIIALTANVMPGDFERCHAVGMNEFLSKPVNKPDLVAKLRSVISSRQEREVHPPGLEPGTN